MLGVEKNMVILMDHDKAWQIEAEKTINELKAILGDIIVDIAHVGSTALPIKAKPIIDIALAVKSFVDIKKYNDKLEAHGYFNRTDNNRDKLLYAKGSYYDGTGCLQTHFIHVVLANSEQWNSYIKFKEALLNNLSLCKDYEKLKLELIKNPHIDRSIYTKMKHKFISQVLNGN